MLGRAFKSTKHSGGYNSNHNDNAPHVNNDDLARERRYAGNYVTVYEIGKNQDGQDSTQHVQFTFETDFGRNAYSNTVNPAVTLEIPPKTNSPAPPDTEIEVDAIDTWLEFTQNTTFHGIRYIFDGKHIHVRKWLWIFAVSAAVFLFLFQVVDRGYDYFSYRSNVNVEVVYDTEVEFPSVTICNQNNFRLTETVRRGMYGFIDDVYSGVAYTVDNLTVLPEDDLLFFVKETAHQKQDLIDSCKWKGRPCDLVNDVTTMLTDFGVCYTFNSGSSNKTFSISQSGSGFALSLVLNIEQYEYMKGPHDEAGLKVLLHDSTEVPLVQDLGFAIAPGTHTLVAVQREQIYSLTQPYGTCVPEVISRSQCIATCRAQEVVHECGCRDAYMPEVDLANGTTAEVCPVLDAYTCLRKQQDELVSSEKTCTCDIPCTRVGYKPELSYAHLSRLSVDKIWLSDLSKKDALELKYTAARETSQRVSAAIAAEDNRKFTNILTASENYVTSLTESYLILRDAQTLQALILSRKNPVDTYDAIDSDLEKITIRREELWKLRTASTKHPNVKEYSRMIDYINDYFLTAEVKMDIYDKIVECEALQFGGNVTNATVNEECDMTAPPLNSARAEADPTQDIDRPYSEPLARKFIITLNASYDSYMEVIRQLYENTTAWEDISTDVNHIACQEILTKNTEKWLPKIVQAQKMFSDFYYTWSFRVRLEAMDFFWELSNYTQNENDSLTNEDNFKVCQWYKAEENEKDEAFAQFSQYQSATTNALLDASGILQTLNTAAKDSETLYRKSEDVLLQPFTKFLDQNLTKIDLYNHLTSTLFFDTLGSISIDHGHLTTDANSFASRLSDTENNLDQALSYAYNLSVWVMRDDFMSDMALLEYVEKNYPTDSYIQATVPLISYNNRSHLGDVSSYIFSTYRTVLLAQISDSSQKLVKLEDLIDATRDDLEVFKDGNELNEDFFMTNYIKVDIFYKELSYDKISQQVAFEFISYLSEVGGFLGLLLGASVLTVCELLDYLALSSMRKFRTENNQPR